MPTGSTTTPRVEHDRHADASGPGSDRQPGHWVLAQLGKRVLRPGGVELTDQLLTWLSIGPGDSVVELGAGIGHTASRILQLAPDV